jgi:choline dehydrogenase
LFLARSFHSWFSEINPALGFPTDMLTGRTLGGSSAQFTSLFIEPPDLSILEDWGIDGLTAATARTYLDKVLAQLDFAIAKPPDSVLPGYIDEWLAAAEAAGIPVVDPTVKGSATDEQHYTASIQTEQGVRIDASSAYIYPLLESGACPNLEIIEGATVTKILIDETTMTATGVTYVTSDDTDMTTPMTATASREVILSAGPYHSPKLLQLSGVGPANVLTAEGIDVVVDLPVGQGTISRPIGQVLGSYAGSPLEPGNNSTVIFSAETLQQFQDGLGGVLGMNVISASGTIAGGTSEVSFVPPVVGPIDTPLFLLVCSPSPPSVGSIRINGTSPFTLPIVELNYLSDSAQLEQIVACTETYHSIMAATTTVPMAPYFPGAGVNFTEFFLTTQGGVGNSYDIVGGSAVGKVVDGSFNVMGVNSLKVIDASSLPGQAPASRPMSLVYMIAEMAASNIIAAWTPPSYYPYPAPTHAPTAAPTNTPTAAPSSAFSPGTSAVGIFVSAVLAWSLGIMV